MIIRWTEKANIKKVDRYYSLGSFMWKKMTTAVTPIQRLAGYYYRILLSGERL